MPKLSFPKIGEPVDPKPLGFPLFTGKQRRKRVITADIWEYLRFVSREDLKSNAEKEALAYIDQAFDFFTAASTPRISSRPLLYYYSFLNLSKLYLLHKGLAFPPALKHGIHDPRVNIRERLHFKTQIVRAAGVAKDRSELFPELVASFSRGITASPAGDYKVIDLLAEVPAIHRTFCAATGEDNRFVPVKSVTVFKGSSEVWLRLRFDRFNKKDNELLSDLRRSTAFRKLFRQVEENGENEVWFESAGEPYQRRGIETSIKVLSDQLCACGVFTILTPSGYRWYFYVAPSFSRLPQPCSAYATMFYLGSLTRYKPYDFDKIAAGFSWIIGEFLDTQPTQLLAFIASSIAETEVVYPFASRVV